MIESQVTIPVSSLIVKIGASNFAIGFSVELPLDVEFEIEPEDVLLEEVLVDVLLDDEPLDVLLDDELLDVLSDEISEEVLLDESPVVTLFDDVPVEGLVVCEVCEDASLVVPPNDVGPGFVVVHPDINKNEAKNNQIFFIFYSLNSSLI